MTQLWRTSVCKLCGSGAPLKKSHIIPKFVGRWLKETSPTPYLRFSGNMNQRLQDLPAIELLCADCENRFSAWETKFANGIFHPSAAGTTSFRYGPWLLKFAASLAWRAIQFQNFDEIAETPDLNSMVDAMELHLSQFLLGSERGVDSFTQHIYPVGELAAPTRPGSPMLNHYLARVVQIDFLRSDDLSEMMVYVKLPMFMFFSVGASEHRMLLETSRIKQSGFLKPKDHFLPESMSPYFLEKSDSVGELLNSMSPKSKAAADKAILEAIAKDPDRVANSRLMRAMLVDYEFYGKEAVLRRD